MAPLIDLRAAAGRGWPPSGCCARPPRSRGRGRRTGRRAVTVPWKSWALPGWPRQRLAHRAVSLGIEHEGRLAVARQVDRGGEIPGVAEPADACPRRGRSRPGRCRRRRRRTAFRRAGPAHWACRRALATTPSASGIVRATAPALRSISLIESLMALATYARPPRTTIAVGWMPTSTCRVAPVSRSIRLTVPDAGAPRSSTTMSRSWLLAVRSPGRGSRPPQLLTTRVRSSSESLGSIRQGLDGILAQQLERRQVDLGDRVAVGGGHEQPRAVAGDRHPAGDRVTLGPRGLNADLRRGP